MLKAARKDAASVDPNIAASGKRRVSGLLAYLLGLFDSRGLTSTIPKVKPGFTTVFGAVPPDPERALDLLEASLEQAAAAVETRSKTKDVLNAIGDIIFAGVAFAVPFFV
jgi:hypothetical protein